MEYLKLAVGLILMIFGASHFIDSSVRLAARLKLNKAVFGALVVAIGTSLPELAVTISAAFRSEPEIVVGNIIGSNIANTGLILGLVILLKKSATIPEDLRRKNTLLITVSLLFIALIHAGLMFWPAGILLLIVAMLLILNLAKSKASRAAIEFNGSGGGMVSWIILVASLIGIIIGSQTVVDSALKLAGDWNISPGVIAATIIAVGTSLPELVITLMAVRKKQHEIALGNVIGSNLFNITLIGGVGATIADLSSQATLVSSIFFLLFAIMTYLISGGRLRARRYFGMLLLGLFVLFTITEYLL